MPIILGTKNIRDTADFNDFAYGITLPIQITNVAFNQSFTAAEQVKSNLKNLLMTKRGERVMQPQFGSELHETLFEQIDDDISERIEGAIETAISTWMPYITIESIDIDISSELQNNNEVKISIQFKISNNPVLESVDFTITN